LEATAETAPVDLMMVRGVGVGDGSLVEFHGATKFVARGVRGGRGGGMGEAGVVVTRVDGRMVAEHGGGGMEAVPMVDAQADGEAETAATSGPMRTYEPIPIMRHFLVRAPILVRGGGAGRDVTGGFVGGGAEH